MFKNYKVLTLLLFSINLCGIQNLYAEEIWTYKQYEEFFKTHPREQAYKAYLKGEIPRINPELMDANEFAIQDNISKSSKWYKKIRYRLRRKKEFEANQNKEKKVLFKVVSKEKNLDMGFVNKKPVTPPTPIPTRERTKEEIEAFQKSMSKDFQDFYTPPTIPSCKENILETEANPLREKMARYEKKPNEVLFDSLLLNKKVLTKIKREKIINKDWFGNRNSIEFYSDEPFDFDSYDLKDKGIKCLPLRVIVTKDLIYRIYGTNALKNYDESLSGIFHHQVKKILNKLLIEDKI